MQWFYLFDLWQTFLQIFIPSFYSHLVDTERCHPTQPFRCPGTKNVCIPIQYLCDGAPDCKDNYDEDPRLCTAGKLILFQFLILFLSFKITHKALKNVKCTLKVFKDFAKR